MATFGRLLESESMKTQKLRLKIYGSKSPPLSLRKKKVEKTIYLRGCPDNHHPIRSSWYVVKLSNKDHITTPSRRRKSKGQKHPVIAIKPVAKKTPISWASRCLALGSTVYSIGGLLYSRNIGGFLYSRNVCTSQAGNCFARRWKEVAPMNARRSCAEAVVVDGKIYVFGGLETTNRGQIEEGPMGEVFDPSKNAWEPISEPPACQNPCFVAYDEHEYDNGDGSKRIILGSNYNLLLAYDVRCDSWEILDPLFHTNHRKKSRRPVLIDNTLYWIWFGEDGVGDGGILAYDLELQLWSQGSIEGLNFRIYDSCSDGNDLPIFFHFYGDFFNLIWLDNIEDFEDLEFRSIIHCITIRVSKRLDKVKEKFIIKGYALSTERYLLDSQMISMDSVVL